jgi:serine/threonine-protein kinase
MLLVPVMLIALGAMAGIYYWGTVSPVTGMLVYGIYFFSLSADRLTTNFAYAFIALIHAALGVGIMTGVLADRGIVKMTDLTFLNQLALVGISEFLYFIAFLTARISQRVTLRAVQRLETAIRQVAQRDAMLAEARAELDRALKIGGPGRFTEHVIGSYKIGNLIGRGGMGEVYEARHVATNEEAAMKTMHAGALADPTLVARFLREATIASRISCPNVVKVLEVGQTAAEIPFIAMERLHGQDLADELRRRRRLPLRAARMLASEIAIGLEAAHAAGIVHRDLKPSNVFHDESATPRWMILDFGVSKVGGSGTLTQGAIIGTPTYMAPEQASGADVDHRADVYSLAAILYRAVTGHPPFTSKDVAALLFDVCFKMPTRPSLLAEVPTDVDRVLALGLAKKPHDRFQTATELATSFADAVEGRFTESQRRRCDDQIERTPWGQRTT